MEPGKWAKEMSFPRPHHAVELVERALDVGGASVICVANNESKLFIAFQLFQEFGRRGKTAGKMVLLVDDESAQIVKPLQSATVNQSMFSVKTYFDEKDVTDKGQCSFPNCDIIVAKANIFLQILTAGKMNAISISLIVFDTCHFACDADHPFTLILKQIETSKSDLRPKIVGLSSGIQHHQTCLQDFERFLNALEEVFNCRASVSHDLIALNRYGEHAEEDIVYYTCSPGDDQLVYQLKEILQNAALFLKDITECDATQECVMFVKHIFTNCHKVLLLFGPQCTAYIAGITLKEIKKLEKKCTENCDILILQFCRTQMDFIVNLSERNIIEGCQANLTDLMEKLLFHMSSHLKPMFKDGCNYQGASCHDNLERDSSSADQPHLISDVSPTCLNSKQPVAMATSKQNQTNCTVMSQQSNVQSNYGVKSQCNDPLCIVLVPTTIIAKALNSLINKVSNTTPEFSFLKSACVHGNKTKQGVLRQGLCDETEDNVMECVQDGSINVLVATFEVEQELYARRCSLVIRQGMPRDYKHYLNVKRKLKSAGAKFVVLVRQEEKEKAEENFKVFQRIESVLAERYPNSRQPCNEIKKIFQEDQPEAAYKPFGEEGPKVDLLSSISLVNSYCSKFPSGGVGAAIPVCRKKEVWSGNKVEFTSTLYLPRNSPVYWPIKGSVTLKGDEINNETAKKAKIQSEMYAALETCRQLHKAGELGDDLEPIFRMKMLSLTAENEVCACEVADSGMGMDGSVKRNRAYKKKFPSILEDNFPIADDPSFVYSINMELTKPWTFERALRSQRKKQSTDTVYCLGILSRKPLPKLPGILVFDRAGEVTATITECSAKPFIPTSDQISLLQRFTEYIFKDVAKPRSSSAKALPHFDPTIASSGYYVVLLKDAPNSSLSPLNGPGHKEIAFDFIQSTEKALGSFDNPIDPPPPGIQDMEVFKGSVVTGVYNEKRPRYYVADICYDRSPADPFPNAEAAATFAEYYQIRYNAQVTLDQPMLDVDHISSRLNFLLPRYLNIKGEYLTVPGKDSKRSLKSQVFVIPELCSVHPLPAYLWQELFLLPAVLYRMESLLVAEEFRASVARALGREDVEWPKNVPLPLLVMGEMVGEEILSKRGSVAEESSDTEIKANSPYITDVERGEIANQRDSVAEESSDKCLDMDGESKSATPYISDLASDEIVDQKGSVAKDSSGKPCEMGTENLATTHLRSDKVKPFPILGTDKPLTSRSSGFVCEENGRWTDSLAEKSNEKLLNQAAEINPTTSDFTDLAGEEVVCQTDCITENCGDDKPTDLGTEKPMTSHFAKLCEKSKDGLCCAAGAEGPFSSHSTALCEALTNIGISGEENLDMMAIAENLLSHDKHSSSEASSANCYGVRAKHKTSSHPASEDNPSETNMDISGSEEVSTPVERETSSHPASEDNPSETNMDISGSEEVFTPIEQETSFPADRNMPFEAVDGNVSPVTIWTDSQLSRLYQSCGPSSTLILRALTTSSAGDVFSLERLEMLGDSFVKYAISSSVFFEHRHENEGRLSFTRGLRVSNRQLFYLARQRGLPSYMITRMFIPLVNWLPPGFYFVDDDSDCDTFTNSQFFLMPDKNSQECDDEDEDGSLFVQDEPSGPNQTHTGDGCSHEAHHPSVKLSSYLHHCCSDKAIADATEALIGAYLLCYGPEGTRRLLEWLGMKLIKQDEVRDEHASNTSLVDKPLEEDVVGSDSTASSQDTSKRPCAACQTFDEPLLKLQKQHEPVASDDGCLPNQTSTDVELTTLEKIVNRNFGDKSQASGQETDLEDLVQSEKRSESFSSESLRLSSHTSTAAELTTQPSGSPLKEALSQPQEIPDPCPCNNSLLPSHRFSTVEFAAIEKVLNYRFSDQSLLLQAFTHTSLPRDYNAIPSSYEQLEFLGDAVIDFLVTRHLYLYHRHMSPGELTDLRSAVVNNYSFSVLAVKLGFAKHLRSLSPPLFSIVNKFIVKLKEKEMKQQQENRNEIHSSVFVLRSDDSEESTEVEVPKVLGDLFEAVAGALYVDCGQDLDMVWQVYQPILKPSVDYYFANPPMSAVRKLLEMMPNVAKFGPLERMVDGKFRSTLTVPGCGTFVGIGRNYRIAKSTAAQRALNALQQSKT